MHCAIIAKVGSRFFVEEARHVKLFLVSRHDYP